MISHAADLLVLGPGAASLRDANVVDQQYVRVLVVGAAAG
jgi:hypothetical protein